MAEAAYADLETPGQVLNEVGEDTDRNTPRCGVNLVKKPIGRIGDEAGRKVLHTVLCLTPAPARRVL
jgi:hypothetical protein